MKQAATRRERNVATKREIKLTSKAFAAKPSAETLAAVHGALDTAVKKNVLNKATAARRKSALSRAAKDAGVKLSAKKATKPAAKPAAKKSAAKPAAKASSKPAAKKPAAKKPAAKKTAAKKA